WQYGITLTHALFRGFADLADAMMDTVILFLNADFILADGSYERLIPYMLAGHRTILAPSYCAIEEDVSPLLEANASGNNGAIAMPPREMAATILAHRHNTIRAKTVNQTAFHFKYADQFYWSVDDSLLLGHQMPIALVAIRPEVALDRPGTFWDWGIVYDFCPSKTLTVIGDSDEFLMMELRKKAVHIELLQQGNGTAELKAQAMSGYITQYQIDSAIFPLTLHSGELPPDINVSRGLLCSAKDEVLHQVSSVPAHSAHAQWVYHLRHLEYWTKSRHRRSQIAKIKDQIDQTEEMNGMTRLEYLRSELDYLSDIYATERTAVTTRFGKTNVATLGLRSAIRRYVNATLDFAYKSVFGFVPDVYVTSVLWPMYRHFCKMMKLHDFNRSNGLLIVSDAHHWRESTCTWLERRHEGLMLERQGVGEILKYPAPYKREFASCIMLLDYTELQQFEALFSAIRTVMRPDATILLHVIQIDAGRAAWAGNLTARIALVNPKFTDIQIGGSGRITQFALLVLSIAKNRRLPSQVKKLLIGFTTMSITPLAMVANTLERMSRTKLENGRSLCARITL
ncbi:MAG: hypothetical protein NT115_12250, partial [Proteobacteria bacterium]|nr:hypothetical protein [Pseudomonadota bacterium]